MAKVISIDQGLRTKGKKKRTTSGGVDEGSRRLVEIADEIDALILRGLAKNIAPHELASVLAHRLGTLMSHIDKNEREILWRLAEKLLKSQAKVE